MKGVKEPTSMLRIKKPDTIKKNIEREKPVIFYLEGVGWGNKKTQTPENGEN